MTRRLALLVLAAVLLSPLAAVAHPDARGMTRGEVVAVTAKGFDLRTDHETITLLVTDDTIVELKKKKVDRSAIKKGDWVDVAVASNVYSELMAGKVVLGVPKPAWAAKKSAR